MIWTAPTSPPPLVSIGQRFNRLVVIGDVDRSQRQPRVMCRCDCGKRKMVAVYGIKYGKTKSCGCLSADIRRAAAEKSYARRKV